MSNEDRKLLGMYDQFSRLSTAFSKETKAREERDLRLAKQLKNALRLLKPRHSLSDVDDCGDCQENNKKARKLVEVIVLELEKK